MEEIEKAFSETSGLLFGRKLVGLKSYEGWLERHVKGKIEGKKSKVSGNIVYVPSVDFYRSLGSNIVTLQESLALGGKKIDDSQLEKLTLSTAGKVLEGIKTTTPEIIYSRNIGTEESSNYGPTQFCYKIRFTWFSKFIANTFWARDSERLFGCSNVAAGSGFCIKCYSSTKLIRCFEVNDSNNCADCYFCHNCEDLRDCMFCFNTMGKRYAIGNVEVGKEEYLRVKKLIQAQIASELEKTKSLRYDIYNIGSKAASV